MTTYPALRGAELFNGVPEPYKGRRRLLLNLAEETLVNLTPEKLLRPHLKKLKFSPGQRIFIVSIGKAARSMAQATVRVLPRKPHKILFADMGHPFPTRDGVLAAQKIKMMAKNLTHNDVVVVLISGGGSAMLCLPAEGITLKDVVATTKVLLASGATIQEMNVIRKHISAIQGGQLACMLAPARVYGFVLSDVVGNDLSTIASGPLSPDKSTFADAIKISKKYRMRLPKNVVRHLDDGARDLISETKKPGDPCFSRVIMKIFADHGTAQKALVKAAKRHRLQILESCARLCGEARDCAKKILQQTKKNTLLISSGETTVTCRGAGKGGRNQEFALAAIPFLKPNQTILALATDGIDGVCPEPIAGIIADAYTAAQARALKLNHKKFLINNDSYHYFLRAGGHIKGGPSGTNLGDLVYILS